MQNALPSSCPAGLHILGPVIDINNFCASTAGSAFDNFIQPGRGLHRAVLVRKDVAVEITEEGETPANMFNGEAVRVGENVSRKACLFQLILQIDHLLNRSENIG